MTSMWHRIGSQLGHPRGMGGRLTGLFMRIANRTPNRAAIAALAPQTGDRILEMGFGPGEAVARLLADVRDVTIDGIDQSDTMVEVARRRNRLASLNGRARLRRADFLRLPFPDAQFDRVLAVNVAYFWPDARAVAGEIRRVLRAGGRASVYATSATSMRRWRFAGEETHRLVDPDALRAAFVSAGFGEAAVTIQHIRLAGGVEGFVLVADQPGGPHLAPEGRRGSGRYAESRSRKAAGAARRAGRRHRA